VPWQYIARRPHVDYQADLPGFVNTSFDAHRFLMPAAISDPTLSDLDGAVKTWQTSAGDQIRKAYLDAMSAAK
jgi:hypothetical protein